MSEAIAIKNREAAIREDEEIEAEEQPESQVDWKSIWKPLGIIAGVFLAFFWLPIDSSRFTGAVIESLALAKWYAQEHVLLCLVPAFFIAGAISVFVSQAAVMKYLGAGANKVMSYGVASVSGTILAVCSCTVLPLFAGIWKRGAGLGPAIAFLYSGPAINVLAIVLTARILGPEIGLARAVGAVVFSIVIGLIMHLLFRKEEQAKAEVSPAHARTRSGATAVAKCDLFCRHGGHPGVCYLGQADRTGRTVARNLQRQMVADRFFCDCLRRAAGKMVPREGL